MNISTRLHNQNQHLDSPAHINAFNLIICIESCFRAKIAALQ